MHCMYYVLVLWKQPSFKQTSETTNMLATGLLGYYHNEWALDVFTDAGMNRFHNGPTTNWAVCVVRTLWAGAVPAARRRWRSAIICSGSRKST